MTHFIMDYSQSSEYNLDGELYKDLMKLSKISKNSYEELKEVKLEKESLVIQLSKSHVLIDSLKFENTMLIETVKSLEDKLKESKYLLNTKTTPTLKCKHYF
jgi:hypothetical protein